MKLYEVFTGNELKIAELIQRRRLQVLVHSCIYYEMNQNLIPDKVFDSWARELVQLQADYPSIAGQVCWADAFDGFDGSTGFDLPLTDSWVLNKAQQLCKQGLQTNSSQPPVKQNQTSKNYKKKKLF